MIVSDFVWALLKPGQRITYMAEGKRWKRRKATIVAKREDEGGRRVVVQIDKTETQRLANKYTYIRVESVEEIEGL